MRWRVIAMALALLTVPSVTLAFEAEFVSASTTDLSNPHDLKLSPDGAWLYVGDVGNDRVVILDAETLELVGHFGSDHQNGTRDVDFDAEGRLYVADTFNHRVTVYDMAGSTGKLAGEIRGGFSKPEGVLVGADGRIYIAGAGSGNMVVFKEGAPAGEVDGLSSPHDLEFAPNGDIWIADAGHDRLLRVTHALEEVSELSGAPYDFDGPRYLDVTPDGTLVIADKYTHSVKVIAEDGELLGVIGGDGPGKGPGRFRTPEGVELSGNTAWFADSGNDRVVKYRLSW